MLMAAGFAFAQEESKVVHKANGADRPAVDLDKKMNSGSADDAKGEAGQAAAGIPITYHGGPVMTDTPKIYVIWYGAWDASSISIIQNLLSGIGGSPRYHINTTYYSIAGNGNKYYVNGQVLWGLSIADNYSLGKNLTDTQIRNIVANAITTGKLPNDSKGIYFLLTAKDVNATSGFCTQYCGWHTYTTVGATRIKYAFVGNPETKCPRGCSAQTISPNANLGADAMASVIVHELEETVTDPALNAWYDAQGNENADKCAWTFGTTSTAPNGSKYNVTINGKNYLIQQNWLNVGAGSCVTSY
jgi:hypothetical protein